VTPREHELVVRRTARYYTLGGGDPHAVRQVWLACHGYGQLAGRFARHFESIAGPERLIVLPEGLSRFYVDEAAREHVGASWMTREHRQAEIADYVAYLDAVYAAAADPARRDLHVTAFGFSQGASTVSRWAALGRTGVNRLVLWGGELPPDLDLGAARSRFAGLEVVLVRGSGDTLITAKVVDSAARRLAEHRIRQRVVEFEGGHELDGGVLATLAD
jgi:predicted esterase